jgi:hypothetical protein
MMKSLIPVLLILLIAATAAADPIGFVGIFFDESATTRSIEAAPGETVHAYLIITPYTGSLAITDLIQPNIYVGLPGCTVSIRYGGVNLAVPIHVEDLTVQAQWSAPLVITGPTVIADILIPVATTSAVPIMTECWCSAENTLTVEFWNFEHLTYCGLMPPPYTEAAWINGAEPVAEEESNWGDLKRLYR